MSTPPEFIAPVAPADPPSPFAQLEARVEALEKALVAHAAMTVAGGKHEASHLFDWLKKFV